MIYDFRNGKTAQLINLQIKERIKSTSSFYFEPVFESYNRLVRNESYFIYEKGEDRYLMFAYLPSYHTARYNGLPKYHVLRCETRDAYTGFTYTSKMPVTIFSKDEGNNYNDVHLSMCKNCQKQVGRNIYSFLAGDDKWYSYVLNYADKRDFGISDQKGDGYIRLWRQLSEAKRESDNWSCSSCKIKLDQHDQRLFLEVHHKDRNKLNNKNSNLQTLCVLCHGNKHEQNYSTGDNLLKVREFFRICEGLIKIHNPHNYNRWKQIIESYF